MSSNYPVVQKRHEKRMYSPSKRVVALHHSPVMSLGHMLYITRQQLVMLFALSHSLVT